MILSGGDALDGIKELGDSVVLAVASVFELVSEILLFLGVTLQPIDPAAKVLKARPAPGLRDSRVVHCGRGGLPCSPTALLQIVGEGLKVILAVHVSLVG